MQDNLFLDNSLENFAPVGDGQGEETRAEENQNDAIPQEDNQSQQVDNQAAPQPDEGGQAENQNNEPVWSNEYKTPEEMYQELQKLKKSYNHLRPEYTRVTQELSKLRKQYEDNQPQTDPQQQTQEYQGQVYTDPNTGRPYTFDEYGNPYYVDTQQDQVNPVREYLNQVLTPIQQQMIEFQMQNEVAKLAVNRQDFKEVAPAMKEILQKNPELWKLGTDRALDIAYNYARASLLDKQMQQAVSDAKQQAYRNKEVKTLVGTDRPRPNTQTTQTSPADMIKQNILSDLNNSSIF